MIEPKPSRKGAILKWTIIILIFTSLGTSVWYYLFGKKPKIHFSVPLGKKDEMFSSVCWSGGSGEIIMFSSNQVSLYDLDTKKPRWQVKMPDPVESDSEWQLAINARQVRLQEWSVELAGKRTALTTPDQIKAFNDDAAKYHAELNAVRAELGKPPPPPKVYHWDDEKSDAEEGNEGDKEAAGVAALPEAGLKPVIPDDPELKLTPKKKLKMLLDEEKIMARKNYEREETQLAEKKQKIIAKTKIAKTPLQIEAANEEEAKYQQELAEFKLKPVPGIAQATINPAEENYTPAAATGAPATLGTPAVGAPAVAGVPAVTAVPVKVEVPEEEEDYGFGYGSSNPQMVIMGDLIWIIHRRHAVGFHKTDGSIKASLRFAGPVQDVFQGGQYFFVVADAGRGASQVNRIAASGAAEPLFLKSPRSKGMFTTAGVGMGSEPVIQQKRVEFSAGGDSLVMVEMNLVQKKVDKREALKPGSSEQYEEDAKNAKAHSTEELQAVVSMINNDLAKDNTGGVDYIDNSTYEVVLKRPYDAGVAVWKGNLTGRVQVFSTPGFDFITSGTKLLAFNHANQLAWESTLAAPVPFREGMEMMGEEFMDKVPCVEKDDRVYFYDAAYLGAYQKADGKVLWRMPSIGIQKVQFDDEGMLYLSSANRPAESLVYTQELFHGEESSLIMKVDAQSGKILWQQAKYLQIYVSGKDVYGMREGHNPNDILDPANAPKARIKIYKLTRSEGKPRWEWFEPRRPLAVMAKSKNVVLLFGNELRVISSIAF